MALPGAIETATAAIGFAADIASFARESRPNKRQVRPIIEALRGIYFTPRGTLNILKVLADGHVPDPDDVSDVLVDFNDHEWEVSRHLRAIDFDQSEHSDMSLRPPRTMPISGRYSGLIAAPGKQSVHFGVCLDTHGADFG